MPWAATNINPLTKTGSNLTDQGGVGYTVVDSLDTMQIMGLDEEYQRARSWISNKMTFDRDANFNTFEVCEALARLRSYMTITPIFRSPFAF